MIAKIYLYIFLLLSFLGHTQNKIINDSILWNKDYKIKWTDFKGAVPFGDQGIKKAVSNISLNVSVIEFINEIPLLKVEVYFHMEGSWTIVNTNDVLKHEQGHFDLAEIYAKKLRKIYKEMKERKISSTNEYFVAFEKINNELNTVQNKYDKEVYFSSENQIKWYEKIKKELETR
ncbi:MULTISPECIES: hypothetical protein [Flavobacterium]|uniref:DUF922 domain-containing protein n=1 Tax=Flavobacterium jumunjinense TaxID=998845 RepID=A0ABV5GPP9_9FLAO|nr:MULTISPECIES: hypothetical protein [Flavobacterium]